VEKEIDMVCRTCKFWSEGPHEKKPGYCFRYPRHQDKLGWEKCGEWCSRDEIEIKTGADFLDLILSTKI